MRRFETKEARMIIEEIQLSRIWEVKDNVWRLAQTTLLSAPYSSSRNLISRHNGLVLLAFSQVTNKCLTIIDSEYQEGTETASTCPPKLQKKKKSSSTWLNCCCQDREYFSRLGSRVRWQWMLAESIPPASCLWCSRQLSRFTLYSLLFPARELVESLDGSLREDLINHTASGG